MLHSRVWEATVKQYKPSFCGEETWAENPWGRCGAGVQSHSQFTRPTWFRAERPWGKKRSYPFIPLHTLLHQKLSQKCKCKDPVSLVFSKCAFLISMRARDCVRYGRWLDNSKDWLTAMGTAFISGPSYSPTSGTKWLSAFMVLLSSLAVTCPSDKSPWTESVYKDKLTCLAVRLCSGGCGCSSGSISIHGHWVQSPAPIHS